MLGVPQSERREEDGAERDKNLKKTFPVPAKGGGEAYKNMRNIGLLSAAHMAFQPPWEKEQEMFTGACSHAILKATKLAGDRFTMGRKISRDDLLINFKEGS